MNSSGRLDAEFERRLKTALLDVLIQAGLIAAMVVLCYQVFSPFLHLTVWAHPGGRALSASPGDCRQARRSARPVLDLDRPSRRAADPRADGRLDGTAGRFGA